MIKKLCIATLALTVMTTSSMAGDYCSPTPLTEVIGATNTLNDSTDLSASLVTTSADILSLSKSLVSAGSTANTEYVSAMLQLSQDILDMADEIAEMADRILVMADDIGDMSDRILETQRIQSANLSLTQSNILKAQANFNSILHR
ncbi:MAG: hypothetical protein U9P38_02680 [Campylobacterota bacterium]|nr:hypothetical protein [Campylobacterota bacterium]